MSSNTVSTTLSSSVPSPTSTPDTHGGFSPGASPPLILAFLAIGLFALSMVGVFGWRRIHVGRFNDGSWGFDPTENDGFFGHGNIVIGPRPKLWDLWTTVIGGTKQRATTKLELDWGEIMPVAVTVTPGLPTNCSTLNSIGGRAGNGNSDNHINTGSAPRTRFTTASNPLRNFRGTRRPEPTSAVNGRATEAGTEKGSAQADTPYDDNDRKERLQVAVAIAMPSRPIATIPNHNDAGSGSGTTDDDTFEYTLGVYECAWKHDNG